MVAHRKYSKGETGKEGPWKILDYSKARGRSMERSLGGAGVVLAQSMEEDVDHWKSKVKNRMSSSTSSLCQNSLICSYSSHPILYFNTPQRSFPKPRRNYQYGKENFYGRFMEEID